MFLFFCRSVSCNHHLNHISYDNFLKISVIFNVSLKDRELETANSTVGEIVFYSVYFSTYSGCSTFLLVMQSKNQILRQIQDNKIIVSKYACCFMIGTGFNSCLDSLIYVKPLNCYILNLAYLYLKTKQ